MSWILRLHTLLKYIFGGGFKLGKRSRVNLTYARDHTYCLETSSRPACVRMRSFALDDTFPVRRTSPDVSWKRARVMSNIAFTFTSQSARLVETLRSERLIKKKTKWENPNKIVTERDTVVNSTMAFKYPVARRDESKVSAKVLLYFFFSLGLSFG